MSMVKTDRNYELRKSRLLLNFFICGSIIYNLLGAEIKFLCLKCPFFRPLDCAAQSDSEVDIGGQTHAYDSTPKNFIMK
jgi:hypothetical protein